MMIWQNLIDFPLVLEGSSHLEVFFLKTVEIQCSISNVSAHTYFISYQLLSVSGCPVERVFVEINVSNSCFVTLCLFTPNCLVVVCCWFWRTFRFRYQFTTGHSYQTTLSGFLQSLLSDNMLYVIVPTFCPRQDLQVLNKFVLFPSSLYLYIGSLFVYFGMFLFCLLIFW